MVAAKLEIKRYRRITACLDYNAEIVDMALASHGLALYGHSDGPHFTKEAA